MLFSVYFRIKKNQSTDSARLEQLMNAQKVVMTPCKNLPGNRSASYDDRFILKIAAETDAAIISNDNYSDLLDENDGKFVNNRILVHEFE